MKQILALPVIVGLIVGRGIFVAISKIFSMLSYSSRMPRYPTIEEGLVVVVVKNIRGVRGLAFLSGKVIPRISQ
jgi:uncharacterized membrane protein YqhA